MEEILTTFLVSVVAGVVSYYANGWTVDDRQQQPKRNNSP